MKEWDKPELVVLVRHEPQEAVLQVCKTDGGPVGGQGVEFGACDWSQEPTAQLCQATPCYGTVQT